jgi:hypothetical protein
LVSTVIPSSQGVHHDLRIARVERGDRLIGQHHLGFLQQGAADRDALLLPAGERVGALQRGRRQVEAVEAADRHGPLLRREHLQQGGDGAHHARAVVQPADQDVGQHVQPLHQVELLEDHGAVGAPPAQRGAAERRDVLPAIQDAAVRRLGQPVDHAQQRGLARARTPDDADHLAVGDRKPNIVDGRHGTETPCQPL